MISGLDFPAFPFMPFPMSLALFDALFGSKARSRLIRFFLLNPGQEFSVSEIAGKILLPRGEISREVVRLQKMKMIFEKSFSESVLPPTAIIF